MTYDNKPCKLKTKEGTFKALAVETHLTGQEGAGGEPIYKINTTDGKYSYRLYESVVIKAFNTKSIPTFSNITGR